MKPTIPFVALLAALGCSETSPTLVETEPHDPAEWYEPEPDTTPNPSAPSVATASEDPAPPVSVQTATWGEDQFGTSLLAPVASGAEWSSDAWSNGRSRSFYSGSRDPYDSMLFMRGEGRLQIHGNGVASVSGRAPRIYIQRPDQKAIWQNVEVTYYARVISLSNPPSHVGLKIGARSSHGTLPFDNCNAKTYYGILRFDGGATINKELRHGASLAGVRAEDSLWDAVPKDQWIGIKFIVRDTPSGDVSMKLYRDMTGGKDGGTWEEILTHVDDGNWPIASDPAGCNYEPDLVIEGKAPAVFARFDGVGRIDLRDFSVRTVEPEFDENLFADVSPSSPYKDAIAWAKRTGLTVGCNPPDNTRFCPDDPVARDQMATFLARFLDLPPSSANAFTDDDGNVHEKNIDAIATEGITKGCNPPSNTRYCPKSLVTREQMASFLTRALSLPASDRDYFGDDSGSIHEDAINRMAAAGLTSGCATGEFCPGDPVTREQMVTFLYRAR